ncbi:MAG: hypothetical protein FJ298_13280 [Planctomycetes bacterium]|nr:hypothetical protein [Planctomycetota bacterium]
MGERSFLGWDRPFLRSAVEIWIGRVRAGRSKSEDCVLVLPGRRAARRVEDLIAEHAPAEWEPPRVVSEGELAQVLRRRRALLATDWQCALAWREALEAAGEAVRGKLWGGGERMELEGLARLCARAYSELAADDVAPLEVARVAESSTKVGSAELWRAYAQVEQFYREALGKRGVVDPSSSAQDALRSELDPRWSVHLLAVVDPPRALRRVLERVGQVDAYVFAPASEASRFDASGFLDVAHWSERDPGLATEQWRCVDSPDEQAELAIAHFAAIDPPPAPENVAIGLADLDVRPFLERRLLELGCEPRWAGGSPLLETLPARLVLAALRWSASRSAEDFAVLARHPDFEALCGLPGGTLAAAVDALRSEHVPGRIDGEFPLAPSYATERGLGSLRTAIARAHELLGTAEAAAGRCVREWADCIRGLLCSAYPSVSAQARDPQGWLHVRALEALAGQVGDLAAAEIVGSRRALAADELAELLERHLAAIELPPAPPSDKLPVVEIFGWLELALDDAEHRVVCGLNEGTLPARGTSGGLLSDPARRELGLLDERRRAARDVWALAAIVAGRSPTLLLSARKDAERNPLVPSRFLFRAGLETTLERVRRAFPEHDSELPPQSGSPQPWKPWIGGEPIPETISVTEFRTYLESPFLYYVQSVQQRRSAGWLEPELDPRAFGTFAHEVLKVLGESELAGCADEAQLRGALLAELERCAHARFGRSARPAVLLQVEKLRARLVRVARWQARQAADGWRVTATEFKADERELDGMRVRGIIDRVDFNDRTGKWRICDYKTGDKVEEPAKVHFKADRFRDLQLPLYFWLYEPRHRSALANVQLGYISVSKQDSTELFRQYLLSDAHLELALQCAREVVAGIRAGKFDELPRKAPLDRSLASLCGFDLLSAQDLEEDESEEEGDE